MQFLQANTEVKVRIGPFVDVADGFTPQTDIALSTADEAELLKNNGSATASLATATWAAVSDCDGWYDLTLTTDHTNTEGLLTVVVQDDSDCLPVFAHFMVLAQSAFISLFTAKDTGYLDVNVKAVSEDTTAADNLELIIETAKGADHKILLSSDAQDLSATLDVNTKLIEGADPTNQIRDAVVDDETRIDASALNTLSGHDSGSTIAKAGDAMTLSDDAITSAKFDESTAFPVKSADSGSTQIARTGADSDTLETLSDEIAAIDTTGPGDYAVTLTIRTTAGAAVAGISVWLNTSNDRTGSVVQAKVTDDSGEVTFNLSYTKYYVFCHLSGYSFLAASFTSAAGSVAFTKDIATAVSTGSASFYADSFLTRARTLARDSLDEPTVIAKYDDDKLATYLESAYIIVLNEKNRNSKTPAVVKQEITVATGVTEYVLPHVMGTFLGLYNLSDSGCKNYYMGRGRFNSAGQRVWLEGNTLHIQSVDSMGLGETLIAEWIPSGVARLHNGTCTVDTTGKVATLGAAPNDGTLDTHVQAYAGGVLRILGVGDTATGNYLQERNITSYDHTTRQATLDVALDPVPSSDGGYVYYEIAPAIYKGMDTVVALYAAYRIMSIEGNAKRAKGILDAYRNELRNVRLTEYFSNLPEAPKVRGDSRNNRRFRRN